MDSIVEFNNVCMKYGKTEIFNDLSFNVEPGKIVGLIAPNGAGKSTIMKLMMDFVHYYSGSIKVCGELVNFKTKAKISYLPDRLIFDKKSKVIDMVEFYDRYYDGFNKEKCLKYLQKYKVNIDIEFTKLSKGTCEIAMFVVAMCRDAQLYLLDEPLATVDPVNREAIITTMLKEYKENSSIIIATHLLTDIEGYLDEVIMIKDKGLLCHREVDEIREETGKSLTDYFKDLYLLEEGDQE